MSTILFTARKNKDFLAIDIATYWNPVYREIELNELYIILFQGYALFSSFP